MELFNPLAFSYRLAPIHPIHGLADGWSSVSQRISPLRRACVSAVRHSWYVRGHVALSDLPDYGIDLPDDNEAYNSVGGLVFSELGRLPQRGDVINVDGYSLRVDSVRENRVTAVRIRPLAGAAESSDSE